MYRSVSQHNTYDRCPYSYKLKYIDKVWQRPASWLSQGLAVHKALEEWEKSQRALSKEDLIHLYEEEYSRSISEQSEETPNFKFWFGSVPYSGEADIERRFNVGKEQLLALVGWCEGNPDQKIWITPDGVPAVELEFSFDTADGVCVKGFIDQIVETPEGLIVRDIKTGAKPGDIFQLATYAAAIEQLYGVEVTGGDYLMGKTGKPTKTIQLTTEDKRSVPEKFKKLDSDIKAGIFPPKPNQSNCRMCSVATSCEFREA